MVRIYVIRHGQTEANTRSACVGSLDYPLNETGLSQAQKLAGKLNIKADAVYCSPLSRAMQTIRPYMEQHSDLKLEIIPELTERDFGLWEDYSYKQISEMEPEQFRIWQDNYFDYKLPNGESLIEVHNRVRPFLDEIRTSHDGQTVFLVTHLCTGRQIISELLGLDAYKARSFFLDNASFAVIDYNPKLGFGTLEKLNV